MTFKKFLFDLCFVQDKDGKLTKFQNRSHQSRTLDLLDMGNSVILLKARGTGGSTIGEMLTLYHCLLSGGTRCAMFGVRSHSVAENLQSIMHTYEQLPEVYRCGVKKSNTMHTQFKNGSSITCRMYGDVDTTLGFNMAFADELDTATITEQKQFLDQFPPFAKQLYICGNAKPDKKLSGFKMLYKMAKDSEVECSSVFIPHQLKEEDYLSELRFTMDCYGDDDRVKSDYPITDEWCLQQAEQDNGKI